MPKPTNLFEKNTYDKEEKGFEQPLHQSKILPKSIKRRHVKDKVIVFGTASELPTDNTTGIDVFFDTTNNKLYVYNGGWKSVTLS